MRSALKQCETESNLFARGACTVIQRQKTCGDLWGQVPECPLGRQNDTSN